MKRHDSPAQLEALRKARLSRSPLPGRSATLKKFGGFGLNRPGLPLHIRPARPGETVSEFQGRHAYNRVREAVSDYAVLKKKARPGREAQEYGEAVIGALIKESAAPEARKVVRKALQNRHRRSGQDQAILGNHGHPSGGHGGRGR